jgi:hypothetical protein
MAASLSSERCEATGLELFSLGAIEAGAELCRSKLMSITPYLYYQDVAGALKFLAEAFGFRKYGVQMRRPDGKINHAEMKFGDDLIMMGYPGSKYRHFGIYWCVFAVW